MNGLRSIRARQGVAVLAMTVALGILPVLGATPAGAAEPEPTPAASAPADSSVDLDGDGDVDRQDSTEAQIAQHMAQQAGTACESDGDPADQNGDGCLSNADVQMVLAAASEPAPVVVVAPSSGDIVVNTTSDQADTNYFDGRCLTSAGTCSLRAAIAQANAAPGPDRIVFAIAGGTPPSITLTSPLPSITDLSGGVTIDGYTQPGARPNASPARFDGIVGVQVIGQGNVSTNVGFKITSANNELRGLAIYNAGRSVVIAGADAHHNRIVGTVLGTDAVQNWSRHGGSIDNNDLFTGGVWLALGAADNQVGAATLADRNVIGGAVGYGVLVEHGGTDRNRIQNNLIGINGRNEIFRLYRGIDLQWGVSDTLVGGYGPLDRNVISGAFTSGVDVSHTIRNTRIIGNHIGTYIEGTAKDDWTANQQSGIHLKDNPVNTLIEHNVLSGNKEWGVWSRHDYNHHNIIRDNRIGVGVNGESLPNGRGGVLVNGTDSPVTGNLIGFNGGPGVTVVDEYPTDHTSYARGATARNRISDNVFNANTGGSIDIAPLGRNANDAGDADTGPNGLLNYPVGTPTASGSITGTACAGCEIEVYMTSAVGSATMRLTTVFADGSGAFTVPAKSVAGLRVGLLAIDPASNTSEISPVVVVPAGPEGTAVPATPTPPTIGVIPNLISVQNRAGSFPIAVTGLGPVAVKIIGLPNGVTYDAATSSMRGTPTTAGHFAVTVNAATNQATTALRFNWTVTPPNRAPVISPIARLVTEASVALRTSVVATDPDGDAVAFTATGLPAGLTIAPDGVITGTPTRPGSTVSTIVATDSRGLSASTQMSWTIVAQPFACTVDPNSGVVSWTSQGADAYFITHTADGTTQYLGQSAGTDFPSDRRHGTYRVTYTVRGTDTSTECAGPYTVAPAFSCSIDASAMTLSWVNGQSGDAYIGLTQDGEFSYLGASNTGSMPIRELYGTYEVSQFTSGSIRTTCAGPLTIKPTFTCSIDPATMLLSWTNGQTGNAYVGHFNADGSSTYLGASSTGSIAIPDALGTYEVHFYTSGHIATTCTGTPSPAPAS